MAIKEKKSKNKFYKNYYIIGGIIILILIIIAYILFNYNINIKGSKILRCSDGTANNSCSLNKPLFCLDGSLKELPNKCGCNETLVLADNKCKELKNLLPESNFTCKELVKEKVSVRFSESGAPRELTDLYNSLVNKVPLKNIPGKYCLVHPKAKAGESIEVENLFNCYGYSNILGGTDSKGILRKSYKITYDFTFDKTQCVNESTTSLVNQFKNCKPVNIDCSYTLTN